MRRLLAMTLVPSALLLPSLAGAADGAPSNAELKVIADTIWVLITAFLVFWMNAGFALLESGFCRRKNAVNILAKNFMVFAITSLIYYALGFGIMYGNGNELVGMTGWFVPDDAEAFRALHWTSVPVYAKFFFQLVFAGTAATIVSGAVAERIHYSAFLIFSVVMGISLIAIGNVMPRVRPNVIAGVRTRSTLSDPLLWRSTHRLLGVAFVLAGVVTVLVGFLAPSYGLIAAAITLIVSCVVAAVGGARARRVAAVR